MPMKRRHTEDRDDDESLAGTIPSTGIVNRGKRLEPDDVAASGARFLRSEARRREVVDSRQLVTPPQRNRPVANEAVDRWADDGGSTNLQTGRLTAPPAVVDRPCNHR